MRSPLPPSHQLPTPWDSSPGRALLGLVDPSNPGELLHAIDLLGGSVTSDALGSRRKAWGVRLQFAGVLRLSRFAHRPASIVGPYNTTCLTWAITATGYHLLAELRAKKAPRFGWEDVRFPASGVSRG